MENVEGYMFTWLNRKFTEWKGFDSWTNTTFIVSTICFIVPAIWASWGYWAEVLTNIPEESSFLTTTLLLCTFALVYLIAFGVLAWVLVYMSTAIGVLVSTILLPFTWFYRKICP